MQPPSRTTLRMRLLRHSVALLAAGAAAAALLLAGSHPSAAAAPATSLTFATWNVCKINCPSPAPPWSVRRDRVARVINESGADVIAVSEATEWPFRSRTQWQDLLRITAPGGYASPVVQRDRCRLLGCTYGSRLLIRSSSVQQVDLGPRATAGYLRVDDIAPGIAYDADRQVAWALLRGTDGAGPFLAVSVHLTNLETAEGERHRTEFGRRVTSWAEELTAARGLAGVPIVLMGDLNSIDSRQPRGVQQILRDAGWHDAMEAPLRTNVDINSINRNPDNPGGWPRAPIRKPRGPASRVDYVMTRGPVRALAYEVVVHLTPEGSFDRDYQGSDHLMLRTRLEFGA